jgi:hypothetical protein
LSDQQVSISYDRRDNVLDDDVIEQMEHVGRTILALAVGQHEEANALLPEILSHPAWGIPPDVVWQISLRAHRDKKYWLEIMQEHEVTKQLFTWLVAASAESLHLPLERILDVIMGKKRTFQRFVDAFATMPCIFKRQNWPTFWSSWSKTARQAHASPASGTSAKMTLRYDC